MNTPDSTIQRFIAAGNHFLGPVPKIVGSFDITWVGSGSVIEIAEKAALTNVKIQFPKGLGRISIGKSTYCRGRIEVDAGGNVSIGDHTAFNRACDLSAMEGASITIGHGCLFSNVDVRTSDSHSVIDIKTGARTNAARDVVIEDKVWLGEGVAVYKGTRIGVGSLIAAGSFVTKSIPPLCVAGGRPAKPIRHATTWKRQIIPTPPLPAHTFSPSDIPLDKTVLQYLAASQQYDLLEAAVVLHAQTMGGDDKLPVFAKWYLAKAKEAALKLGSEDLHLLESVIASEPGHSPARRLLRRLLGSLGR